MPKSDVDKWFSGFEHPLKKEMLGIRNTILAADARINECIKWQSPTFEYLGNLASFNPKSKNHITLMFHTGGKIPGSFRHFEGEGKTAKHMTFADKNEVAKKSPELKKIVKAWCKYREAD